MEEIVEKMKALQVAATNAQPAIAEQLLDELNGHFISLREDFSLLLPEEQANEQNRAMYLNAQRTFYEVGTQLIGVIVPPAENANVPSAENANVPAPTEAMVVESAPQQPEATHDVPSGAKVTVDEHGGRIVDWTQGASCADVPCAQPPPPERPPTAPYRQYQHALMPIFELRPMSRVSESDLNAILDALEECRSRALSANIDIAENSIVLVYLHRLLDQQSQAFWNWDLRDREPTLADLVQFLIERVARLDPIERGALPPPPSPSPTPGPSGVTKKKKVSCPKCASDHHLHRCKTFIEYTLAAKINFLDLKKLCHNCFSATHATAACPIGPCRTCNAKHNSLLCPRNDKNY